MPEQILNEDKQSLVDFLKRRGTLTPERRANIMKGDFSTSTRGPIPFEEESGLVSEAGKATVRGGLNIPLAGGTALTIAGAELEVGADRKFRGFVPPKSPEFAKNVQRQLGQFVRKIGEPISRFFAKQKQKFPAAPELLGNVVDNPELLKNPKWWAANAPEQIFNLGVQVAAGVLAGPAATRMVAGLLEGAGTYHEALRLGKTPKEAAIAAQKQAVTSGLTSGISVANILAKASGKGIKAIAAKIFTSGGLEAVQEAGDAASQDIFLDNVSIDTLKQMATVAPVAFAVGGVTSGGVAAIQGVGGKETAKGKGEPSKAPESQVLGQEEGVKQETGTPLSEAKRKELAEQGFTEEEIEKVERAKTITEDIPAQERTAGEQKLEQKPPEGKVRVSPEEAQNIERQIEEKVEELKGQTEGLKAQVERIEALQETEIIDVVEPARTINTKTKKSIENFAAKEGIDIRDVVHYKTKSGKNVFFNFRAFEKGDVREQLKKLIPLIEEKIGTITVSHAETKKAAEALGLKFKDIKQALKQTEGLAALLVAAKDVGEQEIKNVFALTKKVAKGSKEEEGILQETVARASAVVTATTKMGTNIARAQEAGKIEAAGTALFRDKLNDLRGMLDRNEMTVQEFARRINLLENQRDIRQMLGKPDWFDWFLEFFVNGLLSRTTTQAVNILGNISTLLIAPIEKQVAGFMPVGQTDVKEAGYMIMGYLGALNDMFDLVVQSDKLRRESLPTRVILKSTRFARKGARLTRQLLTGKSTEIEDLTKSTAAFRGGAPAAFGKYGVNRTNAITSGRDTVAGRAINRIGEFVRTPGRAMMLSDEFFKGINYRGALHAGIVRRLSAQNLKGEAWKEAYRDLLTNIPEDLHEEATDFAFVQTFTDKAGIFASALAKVSAQRGGRFLKIVTPFVLTPSRIINMAFDKVPLVGLLSDRNRADLAAGGLRKDNVIARQALGGVIFGTSMVLAATGKITGSGPSDPRKRKLWLQTNMANSVELGGKRYGFNKADPLGLIFTMAADVWELVDEIGERDWIELVGAGILIMPKAITQKSWLINLGEFIAAVTDERASFTRFISKTGQVMFIPQIAAQAESIVSPEYEQVRGFMDGLKSKIPGLSDTLPPFRDLFGDVVEKQGSFPFMGVNLTDFFSPILQKKVEDDIVVDRLLQENINISKIGPVVFGRRPPSSEANRVGDDGILLDPEQYDRLQLLQTTILRSEAGNYHDTLEAVIKGPLWAVSSSEAKKDMIQQVEREFKKKARQALLAEDKELQEAWMQKRRLQIAESQVTLPAAQ